MDETKMGKKKIRFDIADCTGKSKMKQSEKDLQDVLVLERNKSAQHRANYERLKSLNVKLQEQLEKARSGFSSTKTLTCSDDYLNEAKETAQTLLKKHMSQNAMKGASETEANVQQYNYMETEVLEVISKWKLMYLALSQEYQSYREGMEAQMLQLVSEKETKENELQIEHQKIKSELDNREFNSESENRELKREKNAMHSEIKKLREELDETRENLMERTKQCDSLKKSLSDHNFSLLNKGECFNPAHGGLLTRVETAENKVNFLESEVEKSFGENEKLFKELKEAREFHENTTIKMEQEHKVALERVQDEKTHLEKHAEELKSKMEEQQAYLLEVDCFVQKQEEQSRGLIDTFNQHMRKILSEVTQSFQVLEEKLDLADHEKTELHEMIDKAGVEIKKLSEGNKCLDEAVLTFYKKILRCLKLPHDFDPTSSIEMNLCFSKEEKEILSILCKNGDKPVQETVRILEMVLKIVTFIYNKNENNEERLNSRIQELQALLGAEKARHTADIDVLSTKCKTYNRLIRKLRSRLQEFKEQSLSDHSKTEEKHCKVHCRDESCPFCANKLKPSGQTIHTHTQTNGVMYDRYEVKPTTSSRHGNEIRTVRSNPETKINPSQEAHSTIFSIPPSSARSSNPDVYNELQEKHQHFSTILKRVEEFLENGKIPKSEQS